MNGPKPEDMKKIVDNCDHALVDLHAPVEHFQKAFFVIALMYMRAFAKDIVEQEKE